ncbi:MAG: ABC transporter ATP-binding protein [Candidatus Hodarchaeales archaeon]|jgi:ABC-2 type transport system ATP-binding protein
MQKQKTIKMKKTFGKILIQTDGLSKYYGKGKIKAVDDLDLTIHENETFGLLGPNGAGKTTTIRLLNCILKPTRGTADINGYNINEHAQKVKAITGLLAESPGVYDKLSAYEFLEFMGALYKIKGKGLKKRINDLLNLFGLTDRKDYLLEGFSTGMKQKVLIASTLIHDPSIIFFDEPTAGLDPKASHMVKDLIKGLADEVGKTIIICSHILPLVEELCDRIGIINDGRLIAVGTVEEIIEQTGTKTLEEAFISLTGGIDEKELLAWRELA